MAATDTLLQERLPDRAFQSPIHRVNGCNREQRAIFATVLVGFQSPIHRVNGCNRNLPGAAT